MTPNPSLSQPAKADEPAFPTHHNVHDPRSDGFLSEPGMTLRDYFAAKALAAMFSNPALVDTFSNHEGIAKEAYFVADAMLTARSVSAPAKE